MLMDQGKLIIKLSVSFKIKCRASVKIRYIMNSKSLEPQARKWIEAMKNVSSIFGMKYNNIEFPKIVSIPKLIPLPTDYRTVIEDSMLFRCPRNTGNLNNSSPAMCLVCGATICALSKCCSQSNFSSKPVGGATAHAIKCCKGTVLYIFILSPFIPRNWIVYADQEFKYDIRW